MLCANIPPFFLPSSSPLSSPATMKTLLDTTYRTDGGGAELVVKGYYLGYVEDHLSVTIGGVATGAATSGSGSGSGSTGAGSATGASGATGATGTTTGSTGSWSAVVVKGSFQPAKTLDETGSLRIKIPAGQGKDLDLVLWRDRQPSAPVKISYKAPSMFINRLFRGVCRVFIQGHLGLCMLYTMVMVMDAV